MSKNNQIKKSDKKFIRNEKARIRRQFLDTKKQEELISELYKKILGQVKTDGIKKEEPKKIEILKKDVKKEKSENSQKTTSKKSVKTKSKK